MFDHILIRSHDKFQGVTDERCHSEIKVTLHYMQSLHRHSKLNQFFTAPQQKQVEILHIIKDFVG